MLPDADPLSDEELIDEARFLESEASGQDASNLEVLLTRQEELVNSTYYEVDTSTSKLVARLTLSEFLDRHGR